MLPNSSEKRFLLNLRKHSKFATKKPCSFGFSLCWHFLYIEYSKFWRISLEHFVEHKLFFLMSGPPPYILYRHRCRDQANIFPYSPFFFVCAAVIPREQTANLKTVQTNIFLPYFSQSWETDTKTLWQYRKKRSSYTKYINNYKKGCFIKKRNYYFHPSKQKKNLNSIKKRFANNQSTCNVPWLYNSCKCVE